MSCVNRNRQNRTFYETINLWTAARNIDFDISPIEGKKDMYKLMPKEKLSEGFYALHFGSLENISTIEASLGNTAYDIVIGNINDYQSIEVLKRCIEESIRVEADSLLRTMNAVFNNKDYSKLKDIYRHDGHPFSETEFQEFTKGLSTWLNEAGRIKESKIISSNIGEGEGVFEVLTTYEKKGQQTERLVVRDLGGRYYITSLE